MHFSRYHTVVVLVDVGDNIADRDRHVFRNRTETFEGDVQNPRNEGTSTGAYKTISLIIKRFKTYHHCEIDFKSK